MADTWGGIARAMEEGISRNEAAAAREEMYPGHLEAARDANAHGIIGLLSGRHKAFVESNKAQMRELGINPSHRNEAGKLTGRYSSGDWKALQDALAGGQAVTTGLGPDNSPVATPIGDPSLWGDSPQRRLGSQRANIREWGTQNPNMPGSMALDPTWAGGLRGAGLGAEMTPGAKFGEDRDLSKLSRESKFAPGTVPGNITGTRGYLPGRMSVGEARRARAMRNMSIRDREAAGLGNLERFDEFGRISGQFDERMGRMKDKLRDWDIEDRTRRPGIMGGGPSTRIQPDWAALEEDMARRAMAESFIGRDER